ncbi:MAG: hypothetical protein FJ147_22805 [Deltaproteobacteria bacterium]|nr:hypothetical protein [Deltaproteobacteria bacterium]
MQHSNGPRTFRISCSTGNCFGPVLRPMIAEELGEVSFLPDTRYLLLKLVSPASYQDDPLEYLVVTPRYVGVSIPELRTQRCVVGIGRVLPHVTVDIHQGLKKEDVDYFAIGDCEPVEAYS